jgi:flagella synthesis protein FlgN
LLSIKQSGVIFASCNLFRIIDIPCSLSILNKEAGKTMQNTNLEIIHHMVEEDLAASNRLIELLKQETVLTQEREYAPLALLVEEKSKELEILQTNAQQRVDWLTSLNVDTDEQAWNMFLQSYNDISLQEKWQAVKKNLEHCQEINTLNGKLINRGLTSHSRLLDIMRGNSNKADLYNANGNKQAMTSSISFTQA